MSRRQRLVWIDMEMSGLDAETCAILEIATIVTEGDLEIVAEGPSLVVHQDDAVLDAMDEWNTTHHRESGLTEAVRRSTVSTAEAERRTLAFIEEHCDRGYAPLCGNSIHNDRAFLIRYMPTLLSFLHYRIVDVSSFKEMATRWYGESILPEKTGAHRAIDDIRESIDELKHYRERIFIPRDA